jgi:hypothetical protein
MNINAALVKQLRSEKFWSQDELAIASGLNLRTARPSDNTQPGGPGRLAPGADIDARPADVGKDGRQTGGNP